MTSIDLSAYHNLYLQTAGAYIVDMKKNLALFTTDNQDKNALEILHRSAHSLKSQSLVMQYQKTGELCRQLENLFKGIIDKKISINNNLLLSVKQAVEKVAESLASIEKNNQEIDLQTEITSLKLALLSQ